MNRQPLSIRTVLFVAVSTLTLLIALLAGYEVVMEWRQLQKIRSLSEATAFSDRLFYATEKLSVERDVAFSMLHADDPETIKNLKLRLEENRRASDESFTVILHSSMPNKFPELVQLQEEINKDMENIRALRGRIDRAETLSGAGRKALADHWFAGATELTQRTETFWVQFSGHFTGINPIVTQHSRFKHFLRVITDYVGRQRSIIGRLLVENADPAAEESATLLRGQGTLDLSWKISHLLADQSGLLPSIAAQYSDARSHYQTINDMVKDIFYIPGARHGDNYPIDVNLWFELSDQAAESLGVLKDITFRETQLYITTMESQVRRAIFLHVLLMLGALCLCAYSFWLITRRVIQPVNAMVRALVDTMEGKKVAVASQVDRRDEIGKLAKVLHAFQQNAEAMRQASAGLERSESRLRAVVDHTLDGLITISDRGIVENFNPACERIFGYSASEVIGQNIKILMPEPYHSGHDGYLSHYRETGEAKIIGTAGREVSGKRKDGSVFPMDLSVSSFQLEDGRHFSGIIRDITARKAAEREVRESQERYRALVDASAQVVWTWKEGGIATASPLRVWWEETTGQSADAIATFGWLEIVHPDDRDRVKKIWEEAMAQSKDFEMEYRLRGRNGKYLHIEVKGVALLDENGTLREFIGSLNDISARKEAEESLLQYMQALERTNKELDDFAYIASHDLKEPLRGIHNHSRFLLEDNQDKLDKGSIEKLNRLVYLSQRMERLVNDLLYFSRLGRQEMAIQPTDINEVVHDIEKTLELFLAERHASIRIAQPLPVTICDKPRVAELLRNLITNAVKYNDKPEKLVEIGFVPKRVTSQGVAHRNVFYVKDDGRGIAPEFHEEVFRIFKRLQAAEDRVEEGTGVGLTFVKKIVERHGGKIWLESEPGRGTVFYFTLEEPQHDTVKVA